MNLFALLSRGASHAPKPPAYSAAVVREAEKARKKWHNALLVDQTRSWLELGARQEEVVLGLSAVLTLASFVARHVNHGDDNSPDSRVIRGALSAAAQCAETGCIPTPADVRAFSAAAARADAVIMAAPVESIVWASCAMQQAVKMQ